MEEGWCWSVMCESPGGEAQRQDAVERLFMLLLTPMQLLQHVTSL